MNGQARARDRRDWLSPVFGIAGAAIVVAWFLPFARIGGTRPELHETVRLIDLDGSGPVVFLGSGLALIAAAVVGWFPRTRTWALLLGLAGSLIALYLVLGATLSFTDSPVNNPAGGELLDPELHRLLLKASTHTTEEIYVLARPRSGFWLALFACAPTFLLSAYGLIRLRVGRRRSLWLTAAVVAALLVFYWFVALLGSGG